jgi:hypothetical protein
VKVYDLRVCSTEQWREAGEVTRQVLRPDPPLINTIEWEWPSE